MTEYIFTAWAQCRNQYCRQPFTIAGSGHVGLEYGPEGEIDVEDLFSPMLCVPMPDIFELPSKCPNEIKKELRAAFSAFWLLPAACAGRIRVALEHLMNHVGAPKRRRGKNGKYFELSLHARVEAFASSEPKVGPQLMALKWVGNTGSHVGDVARVDLLDAFEVLEHALGEIIDKRSERIAALAKKLSKKHRK